MRKISICNRSRIVKADRAALKRFIGKLDGELPESLRAPHGELSLAILDDDEISKIHADFMDNPNPTDVITFEGDKGGEFAGEICASAETALRQSADFKTSPSWELTLYFAHGYLHLAGIDDISPEDAIISSQTDISSSSGSTSDFNRVLRWLTALL